MTSAFHGKRRKKCISLTGVKGGKGRKRKGLGNEGKGREGLMLTFIATVIHYCDQVNSDPVDFSVSHLKGVAIA